MLIATGAPMARIRAHGVSGHIDVTVTGRLAASDMGRFEHACRPALIGYPAQLAIDMRKVTSCDRTADALVHRIAARGARIRRAPAD